MSLLKRKNKDRKLEQAPRKVTTDLEAALPRPQPGQPAIFVFSIAKSGSTMLNRAFEIICREADVPDTNLPGFFFRAGISRKEWVNYDLGSVITDGYCHRGYRYLPSFLHGHPLLKSRKSVLLLRDLRDAATSQYFSKKYEHPVPGRGKGERAEKFLREREKLQTVSIDEQVFNFARSYVKTWREYVDHLPIEEGLAKVYRYEDQIFEKKAFFRDVLDHFELDVSESIIDEAVAAVDIFPDEERVDKRARVVKPGNHREKLEPKTIDALNEQFREYLTALDYL
jgi:hypothetical protein